MNRFEVATSFLVASLLYGSAAFAGGTPERLTICHLPGTSSQETLDLPKSELSVHLQHGDQLGPCEEPCRVLADEDPPAIPPGDPGTLPDETESMPLSASTVFLQGADESTFFPAGTAITFRLSCPTLEMTSEAVVVYDNGLPLPFEALTLNEDEVTLTQGLGSGRHELHLLARDTFGAAIEGRFVLWVGEASVPVLVVDEADVPVEGAAVTIRLADDPQVSATLVTDASGAGTFRDLPNRSYNLRATAPENLLATQSTSVLDGTAVLRLEGFNEASTIDNNDFSQGTAGWDIGTAPVTIIPHVEDPPEVDLPPDDREPLARTPEAATRAAEVLLPRATTSWNSFGTGSDFDLVLTTSGEGQQSISRTFDVEPGTKSVPVRYRFITSEVPGGYFGTEFNDFFNVSIRSQKGGGSLTAGNSMNGLGLEAFTPSGVTGWFEAELQVSEDGDTVQVDIAVANVLDGLFDSQVVVDAVKEKQLTISELQLQDIDGSPLKYLSASDHSYFGGNTRVHGTLTIEGPEGESLEALEVQVLEGGVIATGTLADSAAEALLTTFDESGRIQLTVSQLLFEIPASGLASANQESNGNLTLRVKARSSSGESAERDFGPVTKLVRFTGGLRYGVRDGIFGGDDWAKPGVRLELESTGHTWNDFSNMNGGVFPSHSSHRTGNSADGWFAGYNARDAATAAEILHHLNTHGTRIRAVYVTFAPNSEFANAIAGVVLDDGRLATSVIRNIGEHRTHFHWEVTDD